MMVRSPPGICKRICIFVFKTLISQRACRRHFGENDFHHDEGNLLAFHHDEGNLLAFHHDDGNLF
jgi:hypothetical protein